MGGGRSLSSRVDVEYCRGQRAPACRASTTSNSAQQPFPFTKRDSKFVTRRRPSDHEFHAEKPPQIAALLRCMFPETVSEYKANSMSVYTLWEHLSSYFLQFYAKNERRHAKNASLWYLTIETQWGRTAVRESTRTGRPGWEGGILLSKATKKDRNSASRLAEAELRKRLAAGRASS